MFSVQAGHTDRTGYRSVRIQFMTMNLLSYLDEVRSTFHEPFSFESPVCQRTVFELVLFLLVHCSPCFFGFSFCLRHPATHAVSLKNDGTKNVLSRPRGSRCADGIGNHGYSVRVDVGHAEFAAVGLSSWAFTSRLRDNL